MSKKPFNLNIPSLEAISRSASANQKNLAGQVIYVDPDECYVVVNPRTQYNLALIESYTKEFLEERQGQREACTVYPKDEKGYRIHHGATRTLAGKAAKKIKADWKIKVIIDPNLHTRSNFENFWEQGTNNVARDNMNLLDVANWIIKSKALAKAENKPLTQDAIAKSIGKTGAWVSKVQALADMPEYLIDMYQNGDTVDPWTLNTLLKIHKADESLCRTFINSGKVDRSTAQRILNAMSLDVLKASADVTQEMPVTRSVSAPVKKEKKVKPTKVELLVAGRWDNKECVILMKKAEFSNHVVIKLLSDDSIKEIAVEEFTLTGYFEDQ